MKYIKYETSIFTSFLLAALELCIIGQTLVARKGIIMVSLGLFALEKDGCT